MKDKLLLISIFFLAFILRFWHLGVNPPSLDWDEVSLGYNAYSLLKTGKDEYGAFLPLSIRSFGDYKPPLYTYLTIPAVALFGLNEFSTRLPSAVFGFLTVIICYLLIKKLFPNKSSEFYLLTSALFALSPWHIQFSRIAFEANIALFFFVSGIWLFLKGTEEGRFLIFSFASFGLSTYAYHSPRLVVPFLLLGLFFIYRKQLIKQLKWLITAVLLLFIIVLPIVYQLRTSTAARFGSVTVVNPNERLGPSIKAIEFDQQRSDILGKLTHNRRIVFAREILAGYLDHFNFDFLFLTGDPPGRHHAVGMGMLYLWDLPFILLGIYYLLKQRIPGIFALFWWFFVAPLASAITTGTPHAVRALLYLPTYQIFAASGVIALMLGLNKKVDSYTKYLKKLTFIFIFSLFILNFYYYLHMYWWHAPQEYAGEWQYGYKQAVKEVTKIEKNFDKIIVTYHYDQPYIFFLFYNQIDPIWYQQNWGGGEIKRAERKFGKYEFRNLDWTKDSLLTSAILVGTADEIPQDAQGLIKEIKYPDGSIAFRIVAR